MKVGIYGGGFNPPHLGHLAAARAAVQAMKLDKLVFVPTCYPPHKELAAGSPSAAQRLEMVRLAADQLLMPDVVEVWDEELCRGGTSYTADTLERAVERWPEDSLWLLMGTDMFLTLQQWNRPEQVLAMAGICAFGRNTGDGGALFQEQKRELEQVYHARVELIDIPALVEISSTKLRQMLGAGAGREYLPSAVYGYILREKLYGTCTDLCRLSLEDLRCVSYSMVLAKRLPHIRGTEEEAARLAQRWGADEDRMRRAAILHDCAKYLPIEEHWNICRRYGPELSGLEKKTEKLLHAKSGSALARHLFGQEEDICQAICFHTTARAGMSLMEKLLYLADYIEPNRDFREVEEMRTLAYTDLDGAVRMGVSLSIQEMARRCRTVHPDTLDAFKFYRKGIGQ